MFKDLFKDRFDSVDGEGGFSLIELVVAMGILITFTGLGVVNMLPVIEANRVAAVDKAAGSVMESAWDWFYDGDVLTDPLFAGTTFNESSSGSVEVSVEVVDKVVSGSDVRCVEVRAWDRFDHEDSRELCVDFALVDTETGEVRRSVGGRDPIDSGSDSGA